MILTGLWPAPRKRITVEDENIAIEVAIARLNASQGTIAKDSVTAAGNLSTKLKNADLIEPVSGFGKGKYKFIAPKE